MYCPNCGKKQGENAKFCYSCGTKIIIPKQDDDTEPSASPMPSISSENSAQTKPIQPIKDTVPQKTEIRNDKAFEATKGNSDSIEDRINQFKAREGEESRSRSERATSHIEYNNDTEQQKNKEDGKALKIGCLFVIIIITLFLAMGCVASMGGGGSTSSSKATCSVCGRSWGPGDSSGNYMKIVMSSMCKSCYNNYKQMEVYRDAMGN